MRREDPHLITGLPIPFGGVFMIIMDMKIDNLYALSQLLQVPIDTIVRGNKKAILPKTVVVLEDRRDKRLYAYYKRIYEMAVA